MEIAQAVSEVIKQEIRRQLDKATKTKKVDIEKSVYKYLASRDFAELVNKNLVAECKAWIDDFSILDEIGLDLEKIVTKIAKERLGLK